MAILLLELGGILNVVINILLLPSLTDFYHIHVYLLAFHLLYNSNYFVCIPLNLILLLSIIFLMFLHTDSLSLLHSILWSGYIMFIPATKHGYVGCLQLSHCKWCCSEHSLTWLLVHRYKRFCRAWYQKCVVQGLAALPGAC